MRILITGGTGMVGSSFNRVETDHELILYGSDQYDLRDDQSVCDMIYRARPDAIIHLAAKVGGVKGNTDYVADFFYDNMIMNLNVLNNAKIYKVPKVLSLLSTCVYPDNPSYPLTESQLHDGEPHRSNFGYAYAKRMLEVHSRAIRQQFGLNYITAIPNNLFGINDNFNADSSHLIPAIIHKLHDAKVNNLDEVVIWGDGSAKREFLYTEELSRLIMLYIKDFNSMPEILNIGTGKSISVFQYYELIASLVGYMGRFTFDKSKPNGIAKKELDITKMKKLGWTIDLSLEDSIKETYQFYKEQK